MTARDRTPGDDPTVAPPPGRPAEAITASQRLPIGRNTALLSAALAANSAMLQLSAAVASLTLVLVIGVEGLLGLGPAIVLASGALAPLPAGRLMDRIGRVPVLAGGFALGAAGCALAAAGSATAAAPIVLLGLLGVGGASGTALLARTAAGDMYPPERRARGIALVLFGAVFGAILGPAVFSPLISGHDLDGAALAVLWLAAGGFMVLAGGPPLARRARPPGGGPARRGRLHGAGGRPRARRAARPAGDRPPAADRAAAARAARRAAARAAAPAG